MYSMVTIPISTYRVYDACTKETLLETRDFNEADEAKMKFERERINNEIELLAVIDA
jgi:hypothetical protein